MHTAMSATVREIHVNVEGGYQRTFFLRVDWKAEMCFPDRCSFQVLLTDGQNAWRGKVGEAKVRSEAEELEMEKERYIQDLQQALMGTETSNSSSSSHSYASSSTSTQCSFTLTPPPPLSGRCLSTMTLAYEKVQKGISLRLGSVLLKAVPDPAEAVKDILLVSVERDRTLKRHNQELQEHNHRLTTEHQHITAELKRYVDGKESLEVELYSRFVLVLNEKKDKLRRLQETIKQLEQQLEEARSEAAASQRSSAAPLQKEEDEYGGSTDEEEPGAQTSTSTSQGARSHSPLISLRDNTDVAPSRKRRIHHPRAADPPEAKRRSAETETSSKHRRVSPQVVSSAAAANQPQAPQQHPVPATLPCAEDLFDEF